VTDPRHALATAAADARPRIVAALIRVTGDWSLAEDCAQDAVAQALERWPRDGVPGNPGGWLMTAARNRAIDVLRRAAVERRKLQEVAVLWAAGAGTETGEGEVVDDRLRLIFTCCHPALALEARVALTLRTVCGVATPDIARAFLVSESAMTRRITRAKTRIAEAGIPYRVPTGPALTERLPGVLAVLYLLFTRGYNADGEPAFADEAIRLARLLAALMPDQPEVAALLALFLFQHSRQAARRDGNGNLLTLDRQDRSRWDRAAIEEGLALVRELMPHPAGRFPLQAAIAAEHARAPTAADTDWPAIARAYALLQRASPTPVVALNRAAAVAMAHGPRAGLDLVDELAEPLAGYHLWHATRADLLRRLGRRREAVAAYRRAHELAGNPVERAFLARRLAELGADAR
jgi:RNA polymerase sigma-70 factor (ECF subfamily)